MRPLAAAVGFYGKLPCRGDFLRRRVPQEFIDVWDGWLQESVSESHRLLQDQWLDAYLTGPIWRFVLTEGVCGTGAYAGVIVPSVDRVGRYFPLTIVAQWNVQESALDVACGAQHWFQAAEALAMEAPDTTDLELFDARVMQLAERIDTSGVGESAHLQELLKHAEFPHRASQWHVPLATVDSLQRAVNSLAFRELERTLRPLSLWWTDGSDNMHAAWLTLRGLPAASSFAAMMTGEWTANGWDSIDKGNTQVRPPLRTRESERSLTVEIHRNDSFEEIRDLATPPLQLTAQHEPISRKWDSPPQSVFFISRPDVGLWGVTSSGLEDARHTAAQALADVLESVPQAGTLTALAEEVRRALTGARRQIAKGQGAGAVDPYTLAHTIVFLARGEECSLICFGEVQAIRCRAANAQSIIGVANFAGDATLPRIRDTESSLMDIVTGTAEPAAIVRYESLQAGDVWLIAGAPLFDEPELPELARSLSTDAPLAAVKAACLTEHASMNGPLPVLLLAASHAVGEA